MQEAAGEYRANSFHSELIQLSTPREDTPEKLTAANIPQEKVMISQSGEEVSMEPPIEGSREALLMFVEQLPQPVTSRITSEGLPKAAKAIRPVNTLGTVAPSQRVASAIEKLEQMRTPAKE